MKKVTDLKENEVIHCPTEAEAIAICKLMHEAGLKWFDGDFYSLGSYWQKFQANTCYRPNKGTFDDLCVFGERGCTIHPASDFLTETQSTPQPEKQAEKEVSIKIETVVVIDFEAVGTIEDQSTITHEYKVFVPKDHKMFTAKQLREIADLVG